MNILVFDIETVPDAAAGRRLYGLEGLEEADAVRAMQARRRQATGGSEFLQRHLHRIVAISVVFRHPNLEGGLMIRSLGHAEEHDEADIIRRFFDGVERYSPTLVSWNGSGFDLPVLHYRALQHRIAAPRYWDEGQGDREFRFNNYINRFHKRHTDLMDVLAGYQMQGAAPLTEVASLLGLPGKMGMDGSQVLARWLDGDLKAIRDYCETDVLNTYGVYLHWLVNSGALTPEQLDGELDLLAEALNASDAAHLREFLAEWRRV